MLTKYRHGHRCNFITSCFRNFGSSGNTFKLDLYTQETGIGSDETRWRFTTTDDGNGHLKLVSVTDAGGAGADVVQVDRGTGTAISSVKLSADFLPTGSYDLGSNLAEWVDGWFSGNVQCAACHVDGDSGGVASTNTLTSGFSGIHASSPGTGTIKMLGTSNADSTGWLHVRIGTNLRYVPFFTTISA